MNIDLSFTKLFYAEIVDSHVCILQETFDPLSGAKLWALPRKELCLCQRVIAPYTSGSRSCSKRYETDASDGLWLSDDPTLIILLTNRRNWTPAKLDKLLGRSHCSKLYFMFLSIVVEMTDIKMYMCVVCSENNLWLSS